MNILPKRARIRESVVHLNGYPCQIISNYKGKHREKGSISIHVRLPFAKAVPSADGGGKQITDAELHFELFLKAVVPWHKVLWREFISRGSASAILEDVTSSEEVNRITIYGQVIRWDDNHMQIPQPVLTGVQHCLIRNMTDITLHAVIPNQGRQEDVSMHMTLLLR